MALAMVEEDHGRRIADGVAARLVLYARRPGFQSQFSDALVAQRAASDPLGPLVAWARANLRGPLDVARLARRAGLSVRTLHRRSSARRRSPRAAASAARPAWRAPSPTSSGSRRAIID